MGGSGDAGLLRVETFAGPGAGVAVLVEVIDGAAPSGVPGGMRGGAPEPSSGLRCTLGPIGRSAYMRWVLTAF